MPYWLAAVIDSADDAIITKTLDGVITSWNPGAQRLFGNTAEEVIGRPVTILIPEDYIDEESGILARIRAGQNVEHYETVRLRKDGTLINISLTVSPIRGPGGEIIGASKIARDITERKRAGEALKESEAQLAGVVGLAMDGIITVDGGQRIVLFNAAAERIFGCPASEALGQTLGRFIPERFRQAHETHVRLFGQAGETQRLMGSRRELHGLRDSGEEFPLEASISQLELNGQKFFTVILRDITERKRAEEALREGEARLAAELADAKHLHKISTLLLQQDNLNALYEQILNSAIGLMKSDAGSMQVLDEGKNELRLLTWKGFDPESARFWERVGLASHSTCGEALRQGERFTLPDVEQCDFMAGTKDLAEYRRSGLRAVQSTPLTTRDGRILGMISTHWREPHEASEHKLHLLDVVARQAADLLERTRAEAALSDALTEVQRLKNKLQEENVYLREEIKLEHNFSEIVGGSDTIKHVLHKIEQVAPTDATVLITGETGTGKELVARAIHGESPRRDRPLIKVNCAALSPTLIESELFGHERGAFTGALGRKVGRFELADGATIFLDEIGELPLELQSKLLRIIQEGEFERLGGTRMLKVDVRIIAATNRDLWKEVQAGTFREDLFYRLNVFPVTMPPLRQRAEDIPLLVEHFVSSFSKKLDKKITSVTLATLNALRHYSWPGNVRELANVIERAVIISNSPVLQIPDLAEATPAGAHPTPDNTLEEVERKYIITVLDSKGWRIEGPHGAARILGLHPSTLRTRMAKLKIENPRANGSS